MKKKEKRKRINQGFGIFTTTKVVNKVTYTPPKWKKYYESQIDSFEPCEACLKTIAKEIAIKHREGKSRFAELLLEELSK
jgi:hypothetical protein